LRPWHLKDISRLLEVAFGVTPRDASAVSSLAGGIFSNIPGPIATFSIALATELGP
jgi:hypothetical protein